MDVTHRTAPRILPSRSLMVVTVTDYRDRHPDDPDDPVEVLYEGTWREAYIDARRPSALASLAELA